ncbi:histidinol-phosphatase HisJ family protein [Clostridium sp. E02]|uniref:histidinol-phosphatase HisJ family protein n=1 Tax=Clostridium sp. E02 TaxID=2487134 RepID=UPI000F5263EE|nr:histidinol-phosphatase HisJ family protein [Clostridium sp. E02]
MLSDYHFHTSFSGDSDTPIRDQLEQGILLGMKSVCVTDHHDYDMSSDLDFTLDLDQYFQTMNAIKEEYKSRIDLRIGIELGLQPHLKTYFETLIKTYPFDFILGSTHSIHKIDVVSSDFFEGRSEEEAYLEYFKATLDNVKKLNTYDVAGHIDYIVRYGPTKTACYHYDAFRETLDAILMAIIRHGKGIECNTAGYRKGIHQPNPSKEILVRYRELGGEIITIGSDAHTPRDLGSDFLRAKDLLLECGFSYYAEFRNRKPEFKPLI